MTHDVTTEQAHAIVRKLSSTLQDVLRDIGVAGHQVALLDWPHHTNVGDSAIWRGELAALEHAHAQVVYRSSFANMSIRRLRETLPRDGVILLHGGGSFGDLYTPIHRFREGVLRRLRDYRIVQLSQSIHFSDRTALNRTADLIAQHPDFTLLARDKASWDVASSAFKCAAHLCPDFAFGLGPIPGDSPVVDTIWLLRTDGERLHRPPDHLGTSNVIADWPGTDGLDRRSTKSMPSLALITLLSLGSHMEERVGKAFPVPAKLYDGLANVRTQRGLRLLSRGRHVVTDRLHGHILSTLLGRQQVLLDNRIGKIWNFHTTWTRDASFVHFAASTAEARTIASGLD